MDYENQRRIEQLRQQGAGLPSNRNFYRYQTSASLPPSIVWNGYTTCAATTAVDVYTPTSTFVLSVGKLLYNDNTLTSLYANPYFIYDGTRYTLEAGLITVVEICDLYML